MSSLTQTKPKRPFGVSIAILTGIALFAIMPLFIAAVLIYLNNRVYLEGDGGFSGLSFLGLSTPAIVFYTVAAVLFLGIALLAWRGRPAAMRFIFPIMVLVMALLMSGLIGLAGSNTNSLESGIDSAQTARQIFRDGYVVIILLVVVYVGWFFNRWSARAFYRGYYTPHDIALLENYQRDMSVG